MSDATSIVVAASPMEVPVPRPPIPRIAGGMTVRLAELQDVPFIDGLQKMHSHMVGFLRLKEIEKYVGAGNVLVAEEGRLEACGLSPEASGGDSFPKPQVSGVKPPVSLGYIIFRDQYLKRDDVGIIYQLNVQPAVQRNLIGAALVKACFEKAAYGCRLYCCWCAQDIRANEFWESVGFVPLAFRTGSRAKQRIHIFWQRRVREGDETTEYWFPSQTSGGAVGEDRIVLPIPLDTHWRDAKPLVLPQRSACAGTAEAGGSLALPDKLPGGAMVKPRPEQPKLSVAQKAAIHRVVSKHLGGVPLGKKAVLTASGIKYEQRTDYVPEEDTPAELRRWRSRAARSPPGRSHRVRELRVRRMIRSMSRWRANCVIVIWKRRTPGICCLRRGGPGNTM